MMISSPKVGGRRKPLLVALTTAAMVATAAAGVVSAGPAVSAKGSAAVAHPSGRIQLESGSWGDPLADLLALTGVTNNHPELDPGSLFTVTNALAARPFWHTNDRTGRAITGKGVTVALLDSGVSTVAGLNAPGKVTFGPDFSGEAPAAAGHDDTFGHGTFMAGLIAANDPVPAVLGVTPTTDTAAPSALEGLAPGANLLSLKLAGADGGTSVDAVIAGLLWVVAHKNDHGMNVRVVNLSFGAYALQPYQQDPLAAAAEAAWRAGIVVVASAGNDGPTAGGVVDPALDPFVISVGSSDSRNSVLGWNFPVVADYSSRGTTARHADVIAPGRSIVSLRDPGSTIDIQHPEGRVLGDTSGRLFRGSGTSQATAVVSGTVALLLQAHPELTPDQVKAALMKTADPIYGASELAAGKGQTDLRNAVAAADQLGGSDSYGLAAATQTWVYSTGLDGLDPGDLTGSWDGARWNGARWNGARWNGARWNGARWNGDSWQ